MNAKRIVSALGGALALTASFAVLAGPNAGPGGPTPLDAAVGSLPIASGAPLCKAAINSDGTIAGGGGTLTSSTRFGVGVYNIVWKGRCLNVTASNGYSTWIQVHTLTVNTINGYCTAADLATNPNGTWVSCYGAGGVPADTSFFIKVEK